LIALGQRSYARVFSSRSLLEQRSFFIFSGRGFSHCRDIAPFLYCFCEGTSRSFFLPHMQIWRGFIHPKLCVRYIFPPKRPNLHFSFFFLRLSSKAHIPSGCRPVAAMERGTPCPHPRRKQLYYPVSDLLSQFFLTCQAQIATSPPSVHDMVRKLLSPTFRSGPAGLSLF